MRVSVLAAFLAMVVPAGAQTLEPKDYSPYEEIAIRTLGIERSSLGFAVSFAVANRGGEPMSAMADCTIFDAQGQPFTSASAVVLAIPPRQEVVGTGLSRGMETEPGKVACRITSTQRVRR